MASVSRASHHTTSLPSAIEIEERLLATDRSNAYEMKALRGRLWAICDIGKR